MPGKAPKTVDEARRDTAPARRQNVIAALSTEMDLRRDDSAVSRLRMLLDGESRALVVSGDIDGLASSMMLAAVVPWRVVAIVLKSEAVLLHPSVPSLHELMHARPFGIDIFSPLYDNISNHTVLWGKRTLGNNREAGPLLEQFDNVVLARAQERVFANASLWARIKGGGENPGDPLAATYRYPLGTAQLLLATLEVLGLSPKMFDREYLPWLIANCDGGLETIRKYHYNVPMWWSALAAAVGPASLSESLYQLAANQGPNEFLSVTHRLRSENQPVADAMDDKWNIRAAGPDSLAKVAQWITAISGWPDPFLDGVTRLPDWIRLPLDRATLAVSKMPSGVGDPLDVLSGHLRRALHSMHSAFAYFDGKPKLGFMGWHREVSP